CVLYRSLCNDTATLELFTLSLHDALPILDHAKVAEHRLPAEGGSDLADHAKARNDHYIDFRMSEKPEQVLIEYWIAPACRIKKRDRKSTRLNSSHVKISYAVFCLKKKKQI